MVVTILGLFGDAFMGSLFKRGKIWYVDIRVSEHRIRKRVDTSKKIALLALQDAEVKAARKEFGFANKDIAMDKFFEQYSDDPFAKSRCRIEELMDERNIASFQS